MTDLSEQINAQASPLAKAARRGAALIPALLIGYSALVDPLINLGPVARVEYGGLQIGVVKKSTLATQLLVPALFALTLVFAMAARPQLPRRLWSVLAPLGLFLGLALISSLWSRSFAHTLTLAGYQTVLCCVIGLSVAISADSAKILRNVFWVFVVVIAVNLVFAVVRPPGPIGHQGIYTYKNTLGSAAGCAFIFALFHLAKGSLIQRLAALATVSGAAFLLVLSISKTATALAVVAPASAIALYSLSHLLKLSVLSVCVVLAGLSGAIYLIVNQTTGNNIDDLLLVIFGDVTFTGRTGVWAFIQSHISDAPYLGHGYRGFWGIGFDSPKHSSENLFVRITGSSHSGYLDTFLDLGAAGLALLMAYILGVVRLCGRFSLRSPGTSMLYLSVVLFILGRNTMESIILWSTFFDAQSFILVGFLAGYCGTEMKFGTRLMRHRESVTYPVSTPQLRA